MFNVNIIVSDKEVLEYYSMMERYFRLLAQTKAGKADPLSRNTYLNSTLPSSIKVRTVKTNTPKRYNINQQSIFNSLLKNQSFIKLLKQQVNTLEEKSLDANSLPPLLLENIYRDLSGKGLIDLAIKGDKDLQIILDSSEEIPVTTTFLGTDKLISYSTVILKTDEVKKKLLEARIDGSEIRIFLDDKGVDYLLKAYTKANSLVFTENAKKIAASQQETVRRKIPVLRGVFIGSVFDSIDNEKPLSKGTIRANRNKYKGGKMLSEVQFSALVRKAIIDDSVKGPIKGPPLDKARGVLTYRTGRYANSIRVTSINFKTQMIRYFYNPIYLVHERSIYRPSKHIAKHIKDLAKQVYGFNRPVIKRA